MANIEHASLTGANLHEPKGVAEATSGKAYISDGVGSGAWTAVELKGVSSGWDTKTANYTLVLTDVGKTIEMSNASARTITIPPNSSVAFAVGTYVNLARGGAGSVTIVAGSGVTIRAPNGLLLNSQYSMATIQKKSTNEWWLAGDLKAS